MGQPLEKVINKLFKGVFRDVYDQYMITLQFIPSGNPKPPTRQLLATWVVKAWDVVQAEILIKSWTECGYPPDYMIGTTNKATIFTYSPKQISTLVKIICGPNSRTNFDSI